jgi:hypothetical protein
VEREEEGMEHWKGGNLLHIFRGGGPLHAGIVRRNLETWILTDCNSDFTLYWWMAGC